MQNHTRLCRVKCLLWPLVLVMLIIFQVGVHAQTVSPADRKVTLDETNVTLKSIFRSITQQTQLRFIGSSDKLDLNQRYSIKAQNEAVNVVLNKLIGGKGYKWEFTNNTVSIQAPLNGDDVLKQTNAFNNLPKADSLISVSGKIINGKGKPLAGASIKIKDTRRSTVADNNGDYLLENVPVNGVMTVTNIGYDDTETGIAGRSKINLALNEQINELAVTEVVSTGYQTTSKERVTGSVVQINNQLLNRRISSNILDRLEGVASGVLFNKGTETNIVVRGTSTIYANANPLIVLDNFPYYGNVNDINPNDVENISILKDAAAASIWGVQSGNGVIVITTKKGRFNQKMNLNVTSNLTIGSKPDLTYDRRVLNSTDYVELEQYLYNKGFYDNDIQNTFSFPVLSPVVEILEKKKNNEISATEADALIANLKGNDVRKDFSKYVYRKMVNQQYAVNINGGNENLAYFMSVNYDKNLSEVRRNGNNRLSINSNTTLRPVRNLEIQTGIIYAQSGEQFNGTENSYGNLTTGGNYRAILPYTRLADTNGKPLSITKDYRRAYIDTISNPGFLDWHYNPLQEIELANNTLKRTNSLFKIAVKYSFLSSLNIQVQYQYQRDATDSKNLHDANSYFSRNYINQYAQVDPSTGIFDYIIPKGAVLQLGRIENKSNYARTQLNFNKTFNGLHSIVALAGAEIREENGTSYTRGFYGYDDEFGLSYGNIDYKNYYPLNPGQFGAVPNLNSDFYSGSLRRYISYFANAAYNYNGRYNLYLSGRKDGANLFGVKTNQKVVPLWSVGAGWDINEEVFYSLKWLPRLKLRTTYGYTGNVYNGSAFLIAQYQTDPFTGLPAANINYAPNPQLKWEKVKNINLGLDFAFRKDRVSGSLEAYQKRGIDLVEDAPLAPSTGYSSYRGNAASTDTKGIDITINSIIIDRKFGWRTSFLFSFIKDKIVHFDKVFAITDYVANQSNSIVGIEGKAIYSIYSYKWAGLSANNGDPQGIIDNKPSTDYINLVYNANPGDLQYHGSSRPTIFGSWCNTFSYHGFSLSANIIYKLNYYFRRTSTNTSYGQAAYNPNADYSLRWKNPGDEKITNVPSFTDDINDARDAFYQSSSILVEKGDHIRLQDITFDYNLTRMVWRKMPFKSLVLKCYVNNVGILWRANKLGLDPDAFVSRFTHPRSISFGINVGL